MPLTRSGVYLASAVAVLAALPGGVSSAADQHNRLEWSVRAVRGFLDVGGQTLFGPASALELEMMIRNDEDSTDFVTLEAGVFDGVSFQLIAADTGVHVPVIPRWADTAVCSGIGRCPLSLRVPLPPGGAVQAVVVLTPVEDQQIQNGAYRIAVDFAAARKYLRGTDNDQWRGILPERGMVALFVRNVETPNDRREYYRIEGGAAQQRGDLDTALRLYQAWMTQFPDEASGYGGVGTIMLELGRFGDAAHLLERALGMVPLRQRGSTALPERLATAHVGTGQEEKAIAMLRQHRPGYSDQELSRVMETARREVTRIRAGRR